MISEFFRRLSIGTRISNAGDGGTKLFRSEASVWEKDMLTLINCERLKLLGSSYALSLDPYASAVARRHSLDMSLRHYFNHVSPEGKNLAERLREARIHYVAAGENIALQPIGLRPIVLALRRQHQGLMASPKHRENILNPTFNTVGIGIVKSKGKLYTTEVFIANDSKMMSHTFHSCEYERLRRTVVRILPAKSEKR